MTAGFADMIKLSEHDYQACKAMDCSQNSVVSLTASCRAIILYNGESPAFTHDIDKLAEHCKKLGETFSDNLEHIADSLTL